MSQDLQMSTNDVHPLGGRLPLLAPETLSGEERKAYDRINRSSVPWAERNGFQAKTVDGELVGPFNPVLRSPNITQSFLDFQDAEKKYTSLSERERQVVILSVGAVWKCDYELYAHEAVARKAGILAATIDELASGRSARSLTDREGVAQRYTLQLVGDRRVAAGLYDEAVASFGPTGLMDVNFLIGAYLCVCAMLNAFEVPAPESAR